MIAKDEVPRSMNQIHVHSRTKRFALRWLLPVVGWTLRKVGCSRKLDANSHLRRILVFRPDHIGDAIMASAVLQPLRNRFPKSHIALCVGPWAAPLFENHPAIDELIVVTLPWWGKIRRDTTPHPRAIGWLRLVKLLRKAPFDLFLDLRSDLRHIALYGVLGAARHILAYSRTGGGEVLAATVPYRTEEHEVVRNIRLLEPLGLCVPQPSLDIRVTVEDSLKLQARLGHFEIGPCSHVITLCPQTRLRVKDWPQISWQQLIELLSQSYPMTRVIVVGDQALSFTVPGKLRESIAIFPGTLSLRELNALFARSSLVVGSDSAPLHLAACHFVPILALFGPTRPDLFAPFSRLLSIIEGNCRCDRDLHLDCEFRRGGSGLCMEELAVERVFLEASRILNADTGVVETNRGSRTQVPP